MSLYRLENSVQPPPVPPSQSHAPDNWGLEHKKNKLENTTLLDLKVNYTYGSTQKNPYYGR